MDVIVLSVFLFLITLSGFKLYEWDKNRRNDLIKADKEKGKYISGEISKWAELCKIDSKGNKDEKRDWIKYFKLYGDFIPDPNFYHLNYNTTEEIYYRHHLEIVSKTLSDLGYCEGCRKVMEKVKKGELFEYEFANSN